MEASQARQTPQTVQGLIDAIAAGDEAAKAALLAHMAQVATRERLAGYADGLRAAVSG